MITLRKSGTRGLSETGWLKSYHSFSFNQYYDPESMNFGMLRVLNDDIVAPGAGFGTHPHHNMEIVTYVISGAVEHKDSTGGHGIIKAGEVQRMSAGSGIMHSEYNVSKTDPVHFLQIWIFPDQRGLKPTYEQKSIPHADDRFTVKAASGKDSHALLQIHQDTDMDIIKTSANEPFTRNLSPDRGYYLFLIDGALTSNQFSVSPGDALMITGENAISFSVKKPSHFVWFDTVMEV